MKLNPPCHESHIILFYSPNRNAHSNCATLSTRKTSRLSSKGLTVRFSTTTVKTQREESVNIYDSVDVLAWNVIYEGPLHASFINVYVITRRRTPRNDIFPRFYVGVQLHRRVASMQRNRYLPWTNVSSLRVINVTREGGKEREKKRCWIWYKIFPFLSRIRNNC